MHFFVDFVLLFCCCLVVVDVVVVVVVVVIVFGVLLLFLLVVSTEGRIPGHSSALDEPGVRQTKPSAARLVLQNHGITNQKFQPKYHNSARYDPDK